MIRFPCRCGYVLEAPADLAGGELQCPECHLLNNVPLAGELQNLEPNGLYKFDASEPVVKPENNLRDLLNIYARNKVDADGNPIDRRNTADMESAADYEIREQASRREKPRYDPETGELVRPIPVAGGDPKDRPSIDASQIPFAKTTVSYAGKDVRRIADGSTILLALMQPTNVITMGFLLLLHLAAWGILALVNRGLLFVAPGALAMILVIFAHYGNVVDDIATEDRDELPRLLRDLRFSDDFWRPMFSVLFTLAVCFGPAIWVAVAALPQPATAVALGIGLAILGAMIAPALLLTLLTSGSLANLRLDRLVSVIRLSGKPYIIVTLLFAAAMIPYLYCIGVFIVSLMNSIQASVTQLPSLLSSWLIVLPMLCAAIFWTHLFCWRLALIYRERHFVYPWVGRYHVRERPPVERRKRNYVNPADPS